MSKGELLDFLTDLREHNSLEWMHANKARQKDAMEAFEAMVQELLGRLALDDPAFLTLRAKDLLSRMNRDTRFSKDKSPYTPALRAHLSPAGRAPVPVGYYLHVEPGRSFLGGGLFTSMLPDATRRVREYLHTHGEAFEAILQQPGFQQNFSLLGEKLLRVPKGYDPQSPMGEYLKHKSWYLEYAVPDDVVQKPEALLDLATEKFRLMRPFNSYLNAALEGFQMPQR